MKWFRRISIAVPLFCLYGGHFFFFFAPSALIWMFIGTLLFIVPLLFFLIGAVVQRDWKSSAILALTWLLIVLAFTDIQEPRGWIRIAGFYAKTKMVSNYLSSCELSDFVENGVKQTMGFCEGHDRDDYYEAVVYDTTGEFVLPASERTPEWKAMMRTTVKDAQVDRDQAAYHLFGHYYAVVISNLDLTG